MEITPRLRIALVGLGDIARKAYLPLLAGFPGVDPVLCTRDPAALQELAARYRVGESFTEVEALIRSRPAAALVHAATEAHAPLVTRLLEADIPTFVDKPLSYSLEESDRLIDLARERRVPLFLGFNRRYAPLVAGLKEDGPAREIHWQKNRVNLPGDPRTFVFDDFIHVVDSLRFLAPDGPVEDLQVHHHSTGGQLAGVQIRWRQGDCLLTGGMNREAGTTEEIIEYFAPGVTTRLHDLHAGIRYRVGAAENLTFGNWTPTLEKRGFTGMLEEWIRIVRSGTFDPASLEEVRLTHALCEAVVGRVTANA